MSKKGGRYKYGLFFPDEIQDPFIELLCAKNWNQPGYSTAELEHPGTHMARAVRMLYTPEQWNVESQWSQEHLRAICAEDRLYIIGSAASSKSWDTGGALMLLWLCDPLNSLTILASTSKHALADRTFASTIKLYKILKQHPLYSVPGRISKTTMAIQLDDSDSEVGTDKQAIRGVALAQGSVEDGRASLVGRHTDWVVLCVDEFAALKQNLGQAALDATSNLAVGAAKGFKFIALMNPESRTDVAGRLIEPRDGWDSVDIDTTASWRTKTGALVLRRDGYKSPAILEPEGRTRYPYLVNQTQIDTIEREFGKDSPQSFTMLRGWPAPQGAANTVLSESDITTFAPNELPVFDNRELEFTMVGGFDPAFSTGGDKAILQLGKLGRFKDGHYGLGLLPAIRLDISAQSSVPYAFQLLTQLKEHIYAHNVPWTNLAIDDSGTQSVADIVEHETGVAPIRCSFGSRASGLPLGASGREAKEQVYDQATEIWLRLALLVRSRQIKGLDAQAQAQFTSRRFMPNKQPLRLETKDVYKARTRAGSPDNADAAALCAMAALKVAGFKPGAIAPVRTPSGDYHNKAPVIGQGYENNFEFSMKKGLTRTGVSGSLQFNNQMNGFLKTMGIQNFNTRRQ